MFVLFAAAAMLLLLTICGWIQSYRHPLWEQNPPLLSIAGRASIEAWSASGRLQLLVIYTAQSHQAVFIADPNTDCWLISIVPAALPIGGRTNSPAVDSYVVIAGNGKRIIGLEGAFRTENLPTGLQVRNFWIGCPYWLAAACETIPIILVARRLLRNRPGFAKGHCQVCGYDLRATPDRCPECGTVQANSDSS